FLQQLRTPSAAYRAAYSGVKRWSRHVDLFSMKFVMVPVVEDEHWSLACLCNLEPRVP
ncbi:unnamed protein product, partial [Ectocarpus sp. 8 AP-2014]